MNISKEKPNSKVTMKARKQKVLRIKFETKHRNSFLNLSSDIFRTDTKKLSIQTYKKQYLQHIYRKESV